MTETSSPSSVAQAPSQVAAFLDALGERAAQGPRIASLRGAHSDAAAPPALDWGRILAIALALAAHLAALVHLMVPPTAWTATTRGETGAASAAGGSAAPGLQARFIVPEMRPDADAVAPERAAAVPASAAPLRPTPPAAPSSDARAVADVPLPVADDAEAPATDSAAPAPSIRLFRSDGSIAVPQAVLDDLQAVESEDRIFSYMTPGVAGADSAFRRPPVVEYTPTRFDADWKPVRSIGADALVAVSEALTYENRSGTFRCSLVPPVCSWGKVVAPVLLDDPHTLNPEEAAECQRVWAAIVDATNQREWLRLRQRFHAECRKPLAVDLAPPAAAEPSAKSG